MALEIDVDELRKFAKLPMNDETAEAYLGAALDYVERYLGRALEEKIYSEHGRMKESNLITLQAWPVVEIEELTVNGAALERSDYALDEEHGLIALKRIRGAGVDYEITYRGGYTAETLPKAMLPAIALLIAALKNAADNGGQVATYTALDGMAVTYASKTATQDDLTMLSPAAAIILKQFVGRAYLR